MKKLIAFTFLALSGAVALAAEVNILTPHWGGFGAAAKRGKQSISKGIITIENKANELSGYLQCVPMKKSATSFTISAESRAENVTGAKGANYCIYADIYFLEGKPLYGRHVTFKNGTHDWEKAELTLETGRRIKQINFYVLFRNMTGKVQFRNVSLSVK